MTSATFAPDNPDWTRQDTNGIVYAQLASIGPGGSEEFGLTGVASYTILASSAGPGDPLLLQFVYGAGEQIGLPLGAVAVSVLANPGVAADLLMETPAYGGTVTIDNFDTANIIEVIVLTSQRVVETPRILYDIRPGRILAAPGGGFTGGTPITLNPIDSSIAGLAVNVNMGFAVDSSGDGLLQFAYLDMTDTERFIDLGSVVGGTQFQVSMPLPQCIGQLVFTPTATDPAGTIVAQAYPARS